MPNIKICTIKHGKPCKPKPCTPDLGAVQTLRIATFIFWKHIPDPTSSLVINYESK